MKRKLTALLLVVCLCVGLTACGGNKQEEKKTETASEMDKSGNDKSESIDPVVAKAMKDFEVIKEYGIDEDGQSNLGFTIKEGSVEDCGEYYKAEAVFAKEVTVDSHLKSGDKVTFVINDLTGEEDTAVYKEKGVLYSENSDMEYWYYPQEGEDQTVLYCFSDDRVESPFYEGTLLIRKDAQCGEDITKTYRAVTAENLFSYYNGVRFDNDGYVTALIFFGD